MPGLTIRGALGYRVSARRPLPKIAEHCEANEFHVRTSFEIGIDIECDVNYTNVISHADVGRQVTPVTDTIESVPSADQPGSNPRGVEVDPTSPYADVYAVYTSSDRAQIAALEATARAFLADVIGHLDLFNPDPGSPYRHATFSETAWRFARARNGSGDEPDDQSETGGDGAVSSVAGGSSDVGVSPVAGSSSDTEVDDLDDISVPGSIDAEPGNSDADDTEPPVAAPAEGGPETRGADSTQGADSVFLPGFPKFSETQTMDGWVHRFSHTEDLAELSAIRGSTVSGTYAHIVAAMTLVHGLPKFHARCAAGEFTIEHILAAAQACRHLRFTNLHAVDRYLDERRADITIETFKKSLAMKIAVLQPNEERTESAREHRRVDLTTYPDGTACLTLTGSSADLQALYVRIEAFAKLIRNGSTAAIADQLPPGAVIDDDRGIAALMFDIFTRTVPQVCIQVRAHDTDTGETTTTEIPLDLDDVRTAEDIDAAVAAAANAGGSGGDASEFIADSEDGSHDLSSPTGPAVPHRLHRLPGVERDEFGRVAFALTVSMPTDEFWMRAQAKMITTVPCMSLAQRADLPGTFSDGSPVPAETARYIAAHSRTWTRILTDPATGTPIDAKALSYQIPAAIRQTLIAQWRGCTAPGCRRRAETSEIDHIIPFDHDDPASGGKTVFGNLHPLCKQHHQAKTDGKYSVRMVEPGVVEYRFAHGSTATVSPPDHPVNAENARLMRDIGDADPPGPSAPPDSSGLSDSPDTPGPWSPPDSPDLPNSPDSPDPPDQLNPPDQSVPADPSTSRVPSVTPEPPRLPGPNDAPCEQGGEVRRPGEVRRSAECPGPEGGSGHPGWMPKFGSIEWKAPKGREWVWDNGEPPPF
ncbi:HNH endonuclease signature motif containing protein [Brevibacterium celere]|uniref:HNH endonuclease n=2 Tax=Brevibacterium TaxID=1696 RepID=A0A7T4A2E8_9MICO|nr:HNH endonuclease [Brevibacterium casei]